MTTWPRIGADQLAEMALFADVPPATRAEVAGRLRFSQAAAGRLIISRGEASNDVYFLLAGTAIGLFVSADGKQVNFHEFHPGSYFGEMSALDGEPRSITVSARDDCRLACLSGAAFRQLLLDVPQIALNLAADLSRRNRHMNDRLIGQMLHPVEDRVRLYLFQLAQTREELRQGGVLEPAPTHEVMAQFVGANREAVSRAIARLVRAGLIEAGRQRIVLRDIGLLVEGLDTGG